MREQDPFREIKEAIYGLSHAFRRHRMTPAIIELASREEGYQLKAMLDREHTMYVELGMDHTTGEPRHQVSIAGVIVRWPAHRRAQVGGGLDFV